MKKISVPISTEVIIGTTPTNVTAAVALVHEARANRHKILEGALTIENEIVQILSHYYFGKTHERKATFEALILNADFCSFSAKRALLRHVIEDLKLLDGEAKQSFEQLLHKVMSYRNAFTHGALSTDGTAVWLAYFHGSPQRKEITDEYLAKIEVTLSDAWHACSNLARAIGAVTPPAEQ